MKNSRFQTVLMFIAVIAVCGMTGCTTPGPPKNVLTVDFQQSETLRYKFLSSRDMTIEWDPTGKSSKRSRGKTHKSSESLDMVVGYTPVKVDPAGIITTIKATFELVKVKRSSSVGRRTRPAGADVAESLRGKSFTFTLAPTGAIEDYSQLESLVKEIGKKAFSNTRRGRMKNPDMIGDIIATQWFLWDAISSIQEPIKGVALGQSWQSKLFVPNPMMLRAGRDVTYTLKEIRDTDKGQLAVIQSSYSGAAPVPPGLPNPYPTGTFQIPGTFGLLGNYKILDLQGEGEELFNIDLGRTEQYSQRYKVQLECSFPLGLRIKPRITIEQNLTMQLK